MRTTSEFNTIRLKPMIRPCFGYSDSDGGDVFCQCGVSAIYLYNILALLIDNKIYSSLMIHTEMEQYTTLT